MLYYRLSRVLALSGLFLLLFVAANWLQAQEAPPRSLEFAIQVAESDPNAYYLPTEASVEHQPEAAPIMTAPEDVPTAWTNLIYETYRDDNWDIYAIRPDWTNLVQLVNNPAVDSTPAFNRGTTAYLFVSDRDDNAEIYKAMADGSNTTRLTNNPAADLLPAWSPDNNQIAFQSTRSGNSDIFVMDANGNNVRQLTFSASYDGAPSWSPDGHQLVFSSQRTGTFELWTMNADGSSQSRIPNTAPGLYPSWSPLGDKIAFSRDHNNNGWLELWIINTDGSNATLLDHNYNQDFWFPAWSPDGDYLAFTRTSWTLYHGQYYWTSSYSAIREAETNSTNYFGTDNRAWKTHWGSIDVTPPTPCTINTSGQQRWPQISFNMTSEDALSGLRSYEAQVREVGESWTEVVANSPLISVMYTGANVGAVDFRCRATDIAGNVRSWDDAPIVHTTTDAVVPTSAVRPLPTVVQGTQTTVRWDGQDEGEGIASYDVYVKDGSGDWTLWRNNVTNTTAVFNGTVGHTYQFRSQATDGIGHTESWRPEADTAVTFYSTHITHTLTDNRGLPVADALVTLSPTAVYSSTSPGLFDGYLADSGSYTANWVAPGYGALPPTDQATAAPFLAVFPPADNALVNGGFEQPDLAPWTTNDPGIMPEIEPHTGQQAVVLPGVGSVMTISQSLTLPANLHQPTLSFLYKLPAGTVLSAQVQTDTLFSSSTAASDWQHVWADLTPYAGQTITLTFSYTGTSESAFLDDVTIGSWHTPQITAVTPSSAQAGDILTITGANFIVPMEASLGDTPLNNVTWISNTELTAQVPDEMSWGHYPLAVNNVGGATAMAADGVLIGNNMFLPIISNNSNSTNSLTKAAWPTLGQNAAHTGYQSGDPGASRYTLAWETTLPYQGGVNRDLEQIAVADGVLVASSDVRFANAGVIALNAYTGQELWRYPIPYANSVNPPTIASGNVFFQQNNSGGYLFSLNLYSGAKNWQAFYSTQMNTHLAPVVGDDSVYITHDDGGIQANNASSGERLWQGFNPYFSFDKWTPAYAHGRLYGWLEGLFADINPDTGATLWNIDVGLVLGDSTIDTSPVIAGNTAVVVSSLQLTAINLDTHQVQWYSSGDHSKTIPAVAGNEVYALRSGQMQVRRVSDGSLLWQFVGDGSLINAPVVTSRYVYVASATHTYVLDRSSHQVVWQVDKGGWLSVADGYLYIAQPDKRIAAYRAQEP